ncbi:cupin domain-containing protein [Herbaspirillum sp. alder98]|uniref:(R)-mandelonitrile lyase n=1 Tax=Herbaspirillum sp. alder98 TaxID=2913096 RepID=UPI001CD83F16|nr:cupin domain-containing protein [Herbaspirillum sp. alder98]MCA1323778.1 cupin domain-containing protein [Herbaspirillum sp. alder98]
MQGFSNIRSIALAIVFASAAVTSFSAAANEPGQQVAPAGTQPAASGPADFFTGRVRVDPLYKANEQINASGAYVTFEPGARSAWHTHPAGQYLVVTAGIGYTQEWGKSVRQLRAGDVVWCPPDVKHWHGAAPTTAMTHMAITGNRNGRAVDWMEKVSDEHYQSITSGGLQ